jgi:thiol:disulfide interchange protein DsbD
VAGAGSLGALASDGLWRFLLLAAGFGLLALLTPCVFPMIPVTVSFFMGEHRGSWRPVGTALAFGGGIVAAFTGAGLLMAVLLGVSSVNRFAASPWLNLALAGFFVVFALALLGALAPALPPGLVQRLHGADARLSGPLGLVVMGVAFTATAFTCTAPFVGTLLVAAAQGAVLWPVLGMAVFSGVFALPFVLLAMFPSALARLRGRSGPWMVEVKTVLGIVELGAALKFVSNADQVWQWGIFTREVLLVLWALVALAVATVLLWSMLRRHAGPRGWLSPRPALVLAALAVAVYLGYGARPRELSNLVESYLPPSGTPLAAAGTSPLDDHVPIGAVQGLPWRDSLPAALAEARATGRPVFVDFTGYTCINCRWMEHAIFTDRAVYEALRDRFVLVRLYTDGGPEGAENQQLQAESFASVALPFYVILSPTRTLLARQAGVVRTGAAFLAFLRPAVSATAAL